MEGPPTQDHWCRPEGAPCARCQEGEPIARAEYAAALAEHDRLKAEAQALTSRVEALRDQERSLAVLVAVLEDACRSQGLLPATSSAPAPNRQARRRRR